MGFRQLLPLFFLVLLLPGITATASCSDVQLNTNTVRLTKNSEAVEYFVIENKSNERFLVDSIEVFDNANGIVASENGFDRSIESAGFGIVGVKVKALNDVGVTQATGSLRIRGHFLSGRECRFEDFGTKQFDIIVGEKEQVSKVGGIIFKACQGIVIDNPADFIIDGREMALHINNDTNYRTVIRMFGDALTINPDVISIPEHSEITETIQIESNREEAMLLFQIENPTCNGLERTRIIKQKTPLITPTTTTAEETSQEKAVTPAEEKTGEKKDLNLSIAATAFAALGQSALLIGAIAIALILLIWLLVQGRKRIALDKKEKIVFRQQA